MVCERPKRLRRCIVAATLFALALLFFFPLVLDPSGFIFHPNSHFSDLTITHWPNALFIRRAIFRHGQIPLWRPLILSGEPFAANPLSGLWYPPNLLLLVLPLTPAFNLLFVFHMAWAGTGGYRLARRLGASRVGALLAALTLMWAPKSIAHLAAGHVGLYSAWSWLPWLFWALHRLMSRQRWRAVALAALTYAALVLADLRLGFYAGLAVAGYWLWGVLRQADQRGRGRSLLLALVAVTLAVALIAVQFLPLAAVAGRLNRSGLSLEETASPSVPWRYLIGLLVPDRGGAHEWMTYVGVVALLLAAVGAAKWRDGGWWLGLAILAGLYALGTRTPLYRLLYRLLPPLRWLRGPARSWFLLNFAVAVLAARGVTVLERSMRRCPCVDRVAVALVGMVLGAVAAVATLDLPTNVAVAILLWPLAGLIVVLRVGGRLSPSWFAALLLLVAWGDLWSMGTSLYEVRPAEQVLAQGQATAQWMAAQPSHLRTYSPSYSLPQHTAAFYEIQMADGVDPFQLAAYAVFMARATGVDVSGYSETVPAFPQETVGPLLMAHRDVAPDLGLLGLLNVRYVLAAYPMPMDGLELVDQFEGVYVYRNRETFPRAFVVGRVASVADLSEALDWLARHDPSQSAVIIDGLERAGTPGMRPADVVAHTPNRIRLAATGPGLLVLSEVYDPDWRAAVDGRPAPIEQVDGVLRGVYLDEGSHAVEFTYRPKGLIMGGVLTATGLAISLGLVVWRRKDEEVQRERSDRHERIQL